MAEQATEGIISFKWNNHKTTFFNVLASLREKEVCTDATLGCEGKLYPVHKLVLCSSSDYFCDIFKETKCKSPVVILKDIHHNNLEALLDYMYLGEVEIRQKDLPDLIAAAECLHIKGLAVPDEIVLTPSKDLSPIKKEETPLKELSPIKKEELSTCDLSPSDSNKEFSLVTNLNDSKLGLQSDNSTFESELLEPLLKRPKQESGEDLKLYDSKNFSSLISKKFCKTVNAVEVPLHGHSSRHQTSLNHLPNTSCLIQKKVTQNEVHLSNTPIKRERLKRKRSFKKSLPMKASVIKNCNIDGVISVKVGHTSLDEVKKSVNSERIENKSLRHVDNVDSDQFDETENCDKSAKLSAPKRRSLEERKHICEEICNEIGLPEFSESLTPYIEGQNLETKERRQLSLKLIDELSEHLIFHNVLEKMENKVLRSTFYHVFQLKILEKYPKIIQEESNQKRGKKGPLSCIINKISNKICSMARKIKVQTAQNNESSSPNDATEDNPNLENVDGSLVNEEIDSFETLQPNYESNPDNMELDSDGTKEDEDLSLHVENT